MTEERPNLIADKKYRKFPVNWLPKEFEIIERIAQKEYFGIKAQYIRRAVQEDLHRRGLLGSEGQIELFPEYAPIQLEKRKIGVKWVNRPSTTPWIDPPRKFMGFLGGLRRNSYKYRWFAKKSREYQDQLFSEKNT